MNFRVLIWGVVITIIFTGCASNKSNKDPMIDNQEVTQSVPIPVGSARVHLEFLGMEDESASVKILEIIGYGSSVDRLNNEETYSMIVNDSVREKISAMQAGDTFEAIVSVQPRMNNDSPNRWSISRIFD